MSALAGYALPAQFRRLTPLMLIILAHVAFLYALSTGLLRQAAQAALPAEIVASFVTPEQPQETARPKSLPRLVPVVKQTLHAPPPVVPVVNSTPSERAISVPVAAAPAAVEAAFAAPVATSTAAVAPAAPHIATISSGVEYIQPPQPVYPGIARRMGEEGKVVLRVLVNEKGRPERIEIQKSSGVARLDEAARQALQLALFKPYSEDGKPRAVVAIVPIEFKLNN